MPLFLLKVPRVCTSFQVLYVSVDNASKASFFLPFTFLLLVYFQLFYSSVWYFHIIFIYLSLEFS